MFLSRKRHCECETSDPNSNTTQWTRHVSNQVHASRLLQLANAFFVFHLTKQTIFFSPSYIFWLQGIKFMSSGTIRLTENITKYFPIIWVRNDKCYSLDRMHMLHFLKQKKISKTYKKLKKHWDGKGTWRFHWIFPFCCLALPLFSTLQLFLTWVNKWINK